MAHAPSSVKPFEAEKTFKAYNKAQGEAYARIRFDYHPYLYETVIKHHSSTGGQLENLVDLGCGPGNVTRALAPHFSRAFGLDPSEGMVDVARSLGGSTSTLDPIAFQTSTAEEIGANLSPPFEASSVDLITAGNAAHWFNMPAFWRRAAYVLKPGGSVAFWTSGHIRVHSSTPNAEALQEVMDEYQDRYLKPYFEPGNYTVRNGYADLQLPWDSPVPVAEFDKADFWRKDWDENEKFFVGDTSVDMDMLEKMIATGSPQTRWAQANPQDVGTDRDIVKILRKKVERLLHEAGVKEGEERLQGAVHGVLLIFKKKANGQ